MSDKNPKKVLHILEPGMIPPTMAARLTHLFHRMRAEGMQEMAAKRRERLDQLGELEFPLSRKERRAVERKKSKSRKPKSP